jgi:hypothetical protein
LLDHNEIFDTPYSGISVGWGWSKLGYSHQNTISHNEVHSYMHILGDGGGIYTLGNQGTAEEKTVWDGNYIHHSGHAQGMYADEGSGFMEIKNNVLHNIGVNWMNMWVHTIHDIDVHNNFADKTNVNNKGTNCTVTDNVMDAKPDNLPEAAKTIIQSAGLEPAFADIKNQVPLPPATIVNDNDRAITYTGKWIASGHRKAGDYNDDAHSTAVNGDSASFTFTGYGIEYLTEYNKDEGQVDVSIDGTLVKTVDCNAPERTGQNVAYRQTWSEKGPHVIKIEKKSGTYLILDAFKVYNRPLRNPPTSH